MVRPDRAVWRKAMLVQTARSSQAMTMGERQVANPPHGLPEKQGNPQLVLNAGITSFANHSNCSRHSDNGKPKG